MLLIFKEKEHISHDGLLSNTAVDVGVLKNQCVGMLILFLDSDCRGEWYMHFEGK